MASNRKIEYISTRVTVDDLELIDDYTDATTMDRAELIRLGVFEYMFNHPAPTVPKSKMLRGQA